MKVVRVFRAFLPSVRTRTVWLNCEGDKIYDIQCEIVEDTVTRWGNLVICKL